MRCPSCDREFHAQPEALRCYWTEGDPASKRGIQIAIQQCPACYELIIIQSTGHAYYFNDNIQLMPPVESIIIFPLAKDFAVPPEVPDEYSKNLTEAHMALAYSAKASAALSRRLLQMTLQKKLGIKRRDLSQEIDDFIENSNAPSYLTQAVDAVRHVGNFAAHPLKFTNTGEIVEVEPGEAEWLIEVLTALFDFVFVQPVRLERRRSLLNSKLSELGKPLLKGE